MIKRNHVALAVFLGSTGQATQAVSRLAVEQFIFELCEDMLLKCALLGIKTGHGPDEPKRKLLVHVVILQPGHPHERAVLPNHGIDAPKILLHKGIALGDSIVVVHVHFLSL